MKPLLLICASILFFQGCAQKKPYHYPNYDIIKPEKRCKPNRENIQKLLDSYLGKPYVWAEEGPYAFDCSGLTYNIYGSMGVDIPRTASEQAKMGKKIPFQNLIYGDLIFFGSTNKRSKRINHVGIYLGNGWFAHASSKERKVTISHFDKEPKYMKRMKLCRRYLSEDERAKYMDCDAPLKKMAVLDLRYTTPWTPDKGLPEKAVP
ncbi:C40 family peptidase [Sulfurovum sp. ST-21]|uniref:C40 family peptidase n=1 Tax=Sulfurovum indicum TaxID=2779528 RepID=A0A7M1S2G1_9BACT|nr:C40 family peptidase [Sulfurovum indicum]QOR61516.1 C40 family peptidase [Sulfurovum indicum]